MMTSRKLLWLWTSSLIVLVILTVVLRGLGLMAPEPFYLIISRGGGALAVLAVLSYVWTLVAERKNEV